MTLHYFKCSAVAVLFSSGSQPQGNSKNSGPKGLAYTPSLERSLQTTLGKITPLLAGVDDDP